MALPDCPFAKINDDQNCRCHCEMRIARRSNLVPGSLGGHEIASLRSQ
jgi:hypothetical protein